MICLLRVGERTPVGHEPQRLSNWFSRMKVTVSIWEMTFPSSLLSLPPHQPQQAMSQRM